MKQVSKEYYENWDDEDDSCMLSVHYGDTLAASDDQFDDMDTDDDAQFSEAKGGQENIVPGETDTSPSTPEDSGYNEIASITSPQVPPNALNDTVLKTILPPLTWETVLPSQPQTPNPEVVTLSLNAMQIQDTVMDDPTGRVILQVKPPHL